MSESSGEQGIWGRFPDDPHRGISRNELSSVNAREELFDAAAEEALTNGIATSIEPIQSSHSRSYLVRFADGSAGVFKPVDQEQKSIGYPHNEAGTYYKRERASYIVDKYLRLGLIPPTVIRTLEGRVGSMQQFIPRTEWYPTDDERDWASPEEEQQFKARHARTARRTYAQRIEEFKRLWLYDLLIWNCDRSQGNVLVKDRWIVGVDNNLTFGDDGLKLYRSHNYTDGPLPEDVVRSINELSSDEEAKEQLRVELMELLTTQEVDAFFSRLQSISKVLIEHGGAIPEEDMRLFGFSGFESVTNNPRGPERSD
ncbi:MAG: hypothetical protein V1907_00745 [Candidatus Kerfeldbacteria bacterium]